MYEESNVAKNSAMAWYDDVMYIVVQEMKK